MPTFITRTSWISESGAGWPSTLSGLIGERAFEYTILFCDPDLGLPHLTIARHPKIFARRIEFVSEAAYLEARRLLRWILAWAGLSAAWQINDSLDPGIELRVAEMAWTALNT
jgi:streptomycin 6-kinase